MKKSEISLYETNRRLVSGAVAVEIANVLGSSTDYILNGEESGDFFAKEVNDLISGVKSDKVKKMILQQLRAAAELDKELF